MAVDFSRFSDEQSIVDTFRLPKELMARLLDPSTQVACYTRYEIKKHSGGIRLVYEAEDRVARFHRVLLRFLNQSLKSQVHDAAHGFVAGRSALSNAKKHVNARLLLRADIKDFFPSIKLCTVEDAFQLAGCSPTVAKLFARLCTIEGTLAQGIHTSPLLANVICRGLDKDLCDLAAACGDVIFTRYADDMAFSTKAESTLLPPPSDIESICMRHEFHCNSHKWFKAKPGQPMFVTGLSVCNAAPRIPKHKRKWLRNQLYFAKKYKFESHPTHIWNDYKINKIDGMLSYLSSTELDRSKDIVSEWRKLLYETGKSPTYTRRRYTVDSQTHYHIFIDETELGENESRRLAVCLVGTWDQAYLEKQLTDRLKNELSDIQSSANFDKLKQNGLFHYTEDHPDTRTRVVNYLRELPFDAYIGVGLLPSEADYRRVYEIAIKRCFRLITWKQVSSNYIVSIEQNSKIKLASIEEIMRNCLDSRLPQTITLNELTKQDSVSLSVPDYINGVWRAFATAKPGNASPYAHFSGLAGHVRAIFDIDVGTVYTRKRPFNSSLYYVDKTARK